VRATTQHALVTQAAPRLLSEKSGAALKAPGATAHPTRRRSFALGKCFVGRLAALLSTDHATQSPSLPQVLPPPFWLAAHVYDPRATLKEFASHVVQSALHVVQSTAAFAQRLLSTVCTLPRVPALSETAVAEVLARQKPFADNTFP